VHPLKYTSYTIYVFHAARPPRYRALSFLLRSVARNPHKNLLCAAAVDDSSTLMPILLPIADYDMETVLLENPSLLDRLR